MHAILFDGDLFDEQPDICLAQGGIAAAKAITQQLTESIEDLTRDPPLAAGELPFE